MTVKRGLVLGSLMVLLAVIVTACGRDYAADWSTVSIPQDTFVTTGESASERAYKDRCIHAHQGMDFDFYKGRDVYFKGRVYAAGLAGGPNLPSDEPLNGVGGAQLVLGPEMAGMSAFILWPGRIPGISDRTAGEPDGPLVEVWGECQPSVWPLRDFSLSNLFAPGNMDGVEVRARYVTVH